MYNSDNLTLYNNILLSFLFSFGYYYSETKTAETACKTHSQPSLIFDVKMSLTDQFISTKDKIIRFKFFFSSGNKKNPGDSLQWRSKFYFEHSMNVHEIDNLDDTL